MNNQHETQNSVSAWAEETFGPVSSNARVAARANEEMAELLRVLTRDDEALDQVADECADVVIVLMRLADRMGFGLQDAIDQKMAVNRGRTWGRDGSGHGYHHVEPTPDLLAAAVKATTWVHHTDCDVHQHGEALPCNCEATGDLHAAIAKARETKEGERSL